MLPLNDQAVDGLLERTKDTLWSAGQRLRGYAVLYSLLCYTVRASWEGHAMVCHSLGRTRYGLLYAAIPYTVRLGVYCLHGCTAMRRSRRSASSVRCACTACTGQGKLSMLPLNDQTPSAV
jgi:hypothetical protein